MCPMKEKYSYLFKNKCSRNVLHKKLDGVVLLVADQPNANYILWVHEASKLILFCIMQILSMHANSFVFPCTHCAFMHKMCLVLVKSSW